MPLDGNLRGRQRMHKVKCEDEDKVHSTLLFLSVPDMLNGIVYIERKNIEDLRTSDWTQRIRSSTTLVIVNQQKER